MISTRPKRSYIIPPKYKIHTITWQTKQSEIWYKRRLKIKIRQTAMKIGVTKAHLG